MALTRVERERINDSRLKIQSAANSLGHIARNKIPELDEIEQCLANADKTLTKALESDSVPRNHPV
jgi:hypothetical protein